MLGFFDCVGISINCLRFINILAAKIILFLFKNIFINCCNVRFIIILLIFVRINICFSLRSLLQSPTAVQTGGYTFVGLIFCA